MAVSTKISVATHILALLEINRGCTLTSDFIASSVNTNPVVIRRTMSQLKKAGILHSVPGIGPSYLVKSPEKISLYDIYQAVEGGQSIFSIHKNPNPACSVGNNIKYALDQEFSKTQCALEEELKKSTLQDIIDTIQKQKENL